MLIQVTPNHINFIIQKYIWKPIIDATNITKCFGNKNFIAILLNNENLILLKPTNNGKLQQFGNTIEKNGETECIYFILNKYIL